MEPPRDEAECAGRGRGRPRDPETDAKILRLAIEQLAEYGYAGMTIDGVARAAGVSKATIYRRFADKNDLVTAAVVSYHSADTIELQGSTRERLVALMQATRGRVIDGPGSVILPQILAESQRNPELVKLHRERTIGPRFDEIRVLLEDGIRAGDLRPDLDIDLVIEMLAGSWMARSARGGDFPADWSERVVDAIWPALAA
jgi:AcrR family transcriptional regulator